MTLMVVGTILTFDQELVEPPSQGFDRLDSGSDLLAVIAERDHHSCNGSFLGGLNTTNPSLPTFTQKSSCPRSERSRQEARCNGYATQ
jgi:hypothetical protein